MSQVCLFMYVNIRAGHVTIWLPMYASLIPESDVCITQASELESRMLLFFGDSKKKKRVFVQSIENQSTENACRKIRFWTMLQCSKHPPILPDWRCLTKIHKEFAARKAWSLMNFKRKSSTAMLPTRRQFWSSEFVCTLGMASLLLPTNY